MNYTTAETIRNLAEDQAFAQEAAMTSSEEEVIALLARHGVAVTAQELSGLMVGFTADLNGELSEDALETVVGGWWIRDFFGWIFKKSEKRCERQTDKAFRMLGY